MKHFSKQSEKENTHQHRHLVRTSDDPLEGSSWMFNPIRQRNFRPSHLKSDSTDDDDDEIVPPDNLLDVSSSLNSLDVNNKLCAAPDQRSRNSLSSETVNTSFNESTAAEPDSTNNMYLNNSLTETTSNSINTLNTTSLSKSTSQSKKSDNNFENKSLSQTRSRASNCSLSIDDTNLRFQRKSFTVLNRRSSSNIINLRSPLEEDGKRVRKPKIHLYPGEEDVHPVQKKRVTKQPKSSLGRKSFLDNIKGKTKVVGRERLVIIGFTLVSKYV